MGSLQSSTNDDGDFGLASGPMIDADGQGDFRTVLPIGSDGDALGSLGRMALGELFAQLHEIQGWRPGRGATIRDLFVAAELRQQFHE